MLHGDSKSYKQLDTCMYLHVYMYVHRRNFLKDPICGSVFIGKKGISVKINSSFLNKFLNEMHEHIYQITKAKADIKRWAEETAETTQQILGTELKNIFDRVAGNLPSLEILRTNIRHSRQDRILPPTPTHTEDFWSVTCISYREKWRSFGAWERCRRWRKNFHFCITGRVLAIFRTFVCWWYIQGLSGSFRPTV